MTPRSRLYVLLVSIPLVAFAVIGGFLGKASARETSYQHLRVFEDVVSLVSNNYVEPVETERVMDGALKGLADGLDADSAWLTPAEVKAIEAGNGAPAGSVGLEFTRQFYLRVIAAREGSPADRAGLRTGDFVRAIDGRSTRSMSVVEGMRLLRGAPGSKVVLTVLRGNAAEPHEVALVREPAAPATVTGRVLEGGIGYLRVPAFSSSSGGQLRAEAASLAAAGARHLIVDLRHTAEGPLDAGLGAARQFLAKGTLAQIETRGRTASPIGVSEGGAITLPTTLLTTTGTSGAAELFASALVGNDRADIVGERTLGRVAVQTLVKLPDASGLWLTTSRYLTPEGKALHGEGLEPTLAVEEPDVEFGERLTTDPILDAALARLREKAAA
ncbi:MAG: PDZ domain-containing protein [Vicinamibacteraceae bacterium]|nr:PDZ domain-containing protein [Vicinamibacteraceae bacterium]